MAWRVSLTTLDKRSHLLARRATGSDSSSNNRLEWSAATGMRHRRHPTGLPLFMLLGIWALAPLGAAIGTVPTGGEFLQAGQLREFLMMWLAFPMTTTIMTTYSGSLGGVGLATLFLIVVSIVGG